MAAIRGFGQYLPQRVLTTAALAARLGVEAEWIRSASGIEERRIADETDTVAAMGAQAARNCLERAGSATGAIGMILVASGTSEKRFPGPAASVAHMLGLSGVPAVDVPMASAGALFAMVMAADLTARFGPVLVVAAERMSSAVLTEPLDKNVAILFGDGAGACLIVPEGSGLQIRGSALHSDGAFAGNLELGFSGPVRMNGRSVIMQASRKIPAAIKEVLELHSVYPQDVRAFLMHQANQNLLNGVARAVGVPNERFPSNIARYGNTSSASMLIAASEYFDERQMRPGEQFCFAAFGAGFHRGALLATVD